MEHLITTIGGTLVALISFLGIMSNNKKDISNKVIDEYKSMNDSLKDDVKTLKDENAKLEILVEELRKKILELEAQVVIMKGGNLNGSNTTSDN